MKPPLADLPKDVPHRRYPTACGKLFAQFAFRRLSAPSALGNNHSPGNDPSK
jgi:hypothetical protein